MRWKRNRKSGSNELRFLVLRKYKVHARFMDCVTFVTCLICVTCATLLLPPGYIRSTSPGSKRSHILNHTENVFRILAARKLEREQKKSKVDEERGYWVSKGKILLLPKHPLLATSIVFFPSLQFWVCPDAENFPYTMPYGKTCYAS